jgi:hypothetical protein
MCNAGRHPYETRYEPRFETIDDRMDIRASDAERDAVVESLRGHAQAGRLTSDELEERVGAALAAKTRADLATLQRDLPQPVQRHSGPRTPARYERHHGPAPLVPIAVLLVVLWAVSGAGYFWPLWPLLWISFMSFRRGVGHMRVTSNTRTTWSHTPHR